MLRSPVYKSTIARIQEVINGGATVKYINLYSKDPQIVNGQRAADLNDPAYWESNYESFGTYNGYKFLYVESSAGVETNEVEPGNISGTLKWDAIMKKTLNVAFDYFVKDSYFKAAKKISGKLSSWLNYYKAPLTISYSPSRDYVKAKVSGDLYIRTVLIQDKLNRVNGYAYYDWGTAEMFAAALRENIRNLKILLVPICTNIHPIHFQRKNKALPVILEMKPSVKVLLIFTPIQVDFSLTMRVLM